ncbi:MAG: M17 family peptidase N-terminal domain-containing protein, partial [Pyrinomonadaceae bacterium]|nr:M17 family peptidase N-terminal domain-containing protein [Pyrinomonadaceae bacterium]
MEFQGLTGNFTEANVEALAIAVFKGEKPSAADLKELDKLTGGQITSTLKSEEIKGDAGDVAMLRFTPKGSVKASRLLLVGVGDQKDYKVSGVGVAAGTAARYPVSYTHLTLPTSSER